MMNNNYEGFPLWYRELQKKAAEKQKETPWPDARQEAWRRTDLKRLDLEKVYTADPARPDFERNQPMNTMTPAEDDKTMRLAFLHDAVRGDYPGVEELYRDYFEAADNRFTYRLLAEPPRGFYLYLPRNYTASDLLFLEDKLNGERGETFTLNLVVLEEGARADLWERIGTEDSQAGLHNRATLFLLKRDASLSYFRTQNLPGESGLFDFSRALIREGAELKSRQAEGELRFNKSHMTAVMEEPQSRADLRGIYRIGGARFNEIFTEQIHLAPRCTSRSFYRGVLEEEARTVYNGMIRVAPEATGTDAYLKNNNLLMNDGCRADSIPGLKIGTNDVKCSHGSTTGKVDPRQMFYLTSRGFSTKEAREILTRAFLEEVWEDAPALVADELSSRWGWQKEAVYV
ncbi:MAG: SufD family Fe-S cluster assembly protein [Spirochaetales bacterium]|nr:SufD family Fe-S cluster assembly protein [Spirochaetales bacterium]